jgi:hypothetical protein
MRDFETIRQMTIDLQNRRSPVLRKMEEIRDAYEADVVYPMPDVRDEPDMPNLTPSLITDVVDGLAMRAASVKPTVYSPSIDPFKEVGVRSKAMATDRRRILSATYHQNGWGLLRRRYMRHLNAYDTASIMVEPDFKMGIPRIRVRDPLQTFPEERALESMDAPEYVAFITRYSGDYLRDRFPIVRAEVGGPISSVDTTELWDVFEWVDTEQIRFGLLGPVHRDGNHINRQYNYFGGPWMPLTDPMPNLAGVCLAVTPGAVTLHRMGNRLNALLENAKWQSKLLALDILAQEKAIFPDMYVLGARGSAPRLMDGQWHDGRDGEINIVTDAERIGTLNQMPDVRTSQMIDRLERNFRVSSGLSPIFGGETPGAALRTGRALNEMTSFSVDPRIQEIHEIDEVWMPKVNEAIFNCYKGWWGDKKFTMFSGWAGDRGQVEFVPNQTIETTNNTVTYAIPGADIIQITQVLGSMLGSETISAQTFQRHHPWIEDPNDEQARITDEKLERGAVNGLLQQVMSGQMPMAVFARIREKMKDGTMDVFGATVAVDEEIREEQAAAQEAAMQEQAAMQQQMSPQAQMGLAAGPQAAAPGALPPEMMAAMMSGGAPAGPPATPTGDMRQMLQAALGGQ